MDPSYKPSPFSSSYRPLRSDPLRAGSSSLPNFCQRPLPLSMAFGDATVALEIGNGDGDVPHPLDCLQGTPIPPFLSKTYDLVDDLGLDHIISWGGTGESFVVWDPVEFARIILPRNFKHNNLSSFVRQLNTYGFRKIDTDRWEFANESFLRGKRHLLRNIQRCKSHKSQQVGSSLSSNEEGSILSIEAEVERLQKEKMDMMQEVIELQQQQRGTYEYMESVNEKLQAAEDRQKQMVSSLAKVFQIPMREKKEQGRLSSPKMVRKFVKHQPHHQGCGLNPIRVNDMVRKLDFGTEIVPLQLQDIDSHEPAQTEDPLSKGESVFGSDFEARPGCFVSSPVNLAKENTMLEFFSPAIDDCRVKQEDIWSSSFETSAAMPRSSNEIWNDVGNYELPEFVVGGSELSDFWNLAAYGAESWLSGETSQSRNGSSGKMDQYGF